MSASAQRHWLQRASGSPGVRLRFHLALQRTNWRLLRRWAIVLFMVGFPLYTVVERAITGGIFRHGDVIEVNLQSMSDFDFDQIGGTTQDIPRRFRALDGKRVVLLGEMWVPCSASDQITAFDLVYSIGRCCFSGPPKVQHLVRSQTRSGATVRYQPGSVKVTGILHVGVETADGRVQSVYRLDVERVDAK